MAPTTCCGSLGWMASYLRTNFSTQYSGWLFTAVRDVGTASRPIRCERINPGSREREREREHTTRR